MIWCVAFKDELDAFIERIEIRAEQKIEEQMVEAQKEAQREEELDRQARLGPGGLDPVEVFESLPDVSTYRIPLNDVLGYEILWHLQMGKQFKGGHYLRGDTKD